MNFKSCFGSLVSIFIIVEESFVEEVEEVKLIRVTGSETEELDFLDLDLDFGVFSEIMLKLLEDFLILRDKIEGVVIQFERQ